MGAYVTVPEVRENLRADGEDTTVTASRLPEARVSWAIKQAEAEIDARLSSRYAVPFNPVPQLVWDVALSIASYLTDLWYRGGVDYESERDPVLLAYARARDLLKGLMDGSIDLPPGDGGTTPEPNTAGATTVINQYAGRMFYPDDFRLGVARRGWHVQ
jgi:phage gp36-like protein